MTHETPCIQQGVSAILGLRGKVVRMKRVQSRNQHCTNKKCPYTHSHTGNFCWRKQKRKCKCPYCKHMRQMTKGLVTV